MKRPKDAVLRLAFESLRGFVMNDYGDFRTLAETVARWGNDDPDRIHAIERVEKWLQRMDPVDPKTIRGILDRLETGGEG